MNECPEPDICKAGDACAGRCKRRSGANTDTNQHMGQFYTSTNNGHVHLVERDANALLPTGNGIKELTCD